MNMHEKDDEWKIAYDNYDSWIVHILNYGAKLHELNCTLNYKLILKQKFKN